MFKPNPTHWQPSDKCCTAARKVAVDLLTAVFGDKAITLEGQCPAFVVASNAIVTASELAMIGESVTSCPHCARVHAANDGIHTPKSVFVGVSVPVPMELLGTSLQASASMETKRQRSERAKRGGNVTPDVDAVMAMLKVK